jgi:hypothetical protein
MPPIDYLRPRADAGRFFEWETPFLVLASLMRLRRLDELRAMRVLPGAASGNGS